MDYPNEPKPKDPRLDWYLNDNYDPLIIGRVDIQEFHEQLGEWYVRQIKKLQKNLQRKIINKISLLTNNPFPQDAKPIQNRKELIRLRYGDYRIIYTIKDE